MDAPRVEKNESSDYRTDVSIVDPEEYKSCDPQDGMHCKALLPLEHLSANQQWENILGHYRNSHRVCKTPDEITCCVGCTQKEVPNISPSVLYGQREVQEFLRAISARVREQRVPDVAYVLTFPDLQKWDKLLRIRNVANVGVVDYALGLLERGVEEYQKDEKYMTPKERQEDEEVMPQYAPTKWPGI